MDFKYDILKHPNVSLTTDGKAQPYRHEKENYSFASIEFDDSLIDAPHNDEDVIEGDYVILTEEEINEILNGGKPEKEIKEEINYDDIFSAKPLPRRHKSQKNTSGEN